MEKTLSQILAENLAYYVNDTTKRCVDVDDTCYYSGETVGIDSDGCFVGRFLTPKDRLKADKMDIMGVATLIKRGDKYGIDIPSVIRNNESLFVEFQALHDLSGYWGKNELSELGKEKLKEVIQRFSLDGKEFEKFFS
jgi:hypothetical protein